MPMVRARVAVRQHWCSTLIDPLLYHLKNKVVMLRRCIENELASFRNGVATIIISE